LSPGAWCLGKTKDQRSFYGRTMGEASGGPNKSVDLTNEDTVRYLRIVKEAVTRKKVLQIQRTFIKDEAYRMKASTRCIFVI